MTNDPESNLQNQAKPGKRGNNPTGKGGLKPGYDPRRWLGGRGKKSPEQKEGEQILLAVIWEELSREFDTEGMKPKETPETIDALRLMVRSWIKKKPELIAERIAGKVIEKHDLTTGGEKLQPPQVIEVIKTYVKDNDEPA
jgi:hypothetical protein